MRLADARLKAAEYKRSAKEGIDPTSVKEGVKEKNERSGLFWRDIAQDYLMLRQRSGAAQRTLQKLHRQIQVTIVALGDREIREIPADRMKMKREHIVPLPKQAVQVLREVKDTDIGAELVFPAPRDPRKMMSDATFGKALRSMGYSSDRHVHHGFRTTASTLLNELGWNADWIERQLAHIQQNRIRASYNKAEYLDGRVEMMQAYAEKLEHISTSNT